MTTKVLSLKTFQRYWKVTNILSSALSSKLRSFMTSTTSTKKKIHYLPPNSTKILIISFSILYANTSMFYQATTEILHIIKLLNFIKFISDNTAVTVFETKDFCTLILLTNDTTMHS